MNWRVISEPEHVKIGRVPADSTRKILFRRRGDSRWTNASNFIRLVSRLGTRIRVGRSALVRHCSGRNAQLRVNTRAMYAHASTGQLLLITKPGQDINHSYPWEVSAPCLNVLHKAKRNTPERMFKEGEMETGIRSALENYARLSRM